MVWPSLFEGLKFLLHGSPLVCSGNTQCFTTGFSHADCWCAFFSLSRCLTTCTHAHTHWRCPTTYLLPLTLRSVLKWSHTLAKQCQPPFLLFLLVWRILLGQWLPSLASFFFFPPCFPVPLHPWPQTHCLTLAYRGSTNAAQQWRETNWPISPATVLQLKKFFF